MSNTVDLKNAVINKQSELILSRRDKFYLRYLMYSDNYREQVRRRLEEIYTGATQLRLDKQMDLTNNIYKTIINKISRVYSFGVARNTESETLEEYINEGHIDKAMKQANKYVNAFNDILLQVSWNYTENKPNLIFRLPHKTEVTTDQDGNITEVEYFISIDADKKQKWAYWNDKEHYYEVYSQDGQTFEKEFVEGNDKGINPFDMLPFVSMKSGFRDSSFWDTNTGDDLVEITLDNSVYNTFKNYMIKWQSFKQIVITGNNIGAINGQILDPQKALTVSGEDTSVSLLDLQSNIKELQETIQNNAINVAINYNISPNQFRMTGQVSSGFALQMENKELDEYTIDQQKDFLGYEQKLFDLIALAYTKLGNKDTVNDVEIEFIKPTYQESRTVTLDSYQKAIDLGIRNAVEIISNEKNISEDEALEIYNKNIAFRNKANNKLNSGELNLATTATALEEANE